jgi:hypothetical protein
MRRFFSTRRMNGYRAVFGIGYGRVGIGDDVPAARTADANVIRNITRIALCGPMGARCREKFYIFEQTVCAVTRTPFCL